MVDGAAAIARGALDAGCNFYAGYPITPASGILTHMLRELPKVGGIGLQGEDEISSMGHCIGAATAGATVFTATSGPGLSLYSENIGLAIMMEVPLVIAISQRLGPSTGAATASAQGDIQFMRWCTSGGYPIIVLSPTNIPESYHLTKRAFKLAKKFRTPVFVATDPALDGPGLSAYSTGPIAQGQNSSSPIPCASLLVCFPLATAIISSKISCPTSWTDAPSRIRPALMSMSSIIQSNIGLFEAILIQGTGLQPKQLPRPVVNTSTLAPPATIPVIDAGS